MCSIFNAYVYFCLLLVNNTHIFYVYYLMWLHIQTLSQAIVKVVIPTERYMFFFIITDLNIDNIPFWIKEKWCWGKGNILTEQWFLPSTFWGDIWDLTNFSVLCNFVSLFFAFIVINIGNFIALIVRIYLIDLIWSC